MRIDFAADRRRLGLALLVVAILVTALAWALPPDWQAQVQRAPPELRAQLQQNAQAWRSWTASERTQFRQRATQWDALARQQRATRREAYLAWRQLESIDREQVQAARARYATLSPDAQQALRARFAAQDTSLRRGWLLGPRLGADYPGLRPLLMQVPAQQREPLLQALRAMSPAARADLAVLAQRTPPQERNALRRALLSTAATNREQWLRDKVLE